MKYLKILLPILLISIMLGGCTSVRFNQKQRLGDRTMIFDYDAAAAKMQGHILTPREGSIGGFSSAGAGGCGCN